MLPPPVPAHYSRKYLSGTYYTSHIGLVDWDVARDKMDKNACFRGVYVVRNSQYKL